MDPLEIRPLSEVLAAGRTAWPKVDLSERDLAAYLSAGGIQPQALQEHGADLCLTAACVARIPAALASFDARFLSRVNQYLARMHLCLDLVDDIRQRLRIRMIGPEMKISSYTGMAPLDRWLRLACVRLALDVIESEARHVRPERDDELLQRVAGSDNPEFNAIRARYAGMIQAELRQAIDGLDTRDKTILRLHFVEGLNIEGIGKIYGVHRATAARWIAGIRTQLLECLRQRLHVEIGATSSEFASLIACVNHELAVSITRLLAP
jgi:RNA polymerase sigma-70 factor (ECF subfamily)